MSTFSKTSLPPIIRLSGSSDVGYTLRSSTSLASPPARLVRGRRVESVEGMLVRAYKAPPSLLSPRNRKTKQRRRKV
jgi:hypothetical protein